MRKTEKLKRRFIVNPPAHLVRTGFFGRCCLSLFVLFCFRPFCFVSSFCFRPLLFPNSLITIPIHYVPECYTYYLRLVRLETKCASFHFRPKCSKLFMIIKMYMLLRQKRIEIKPFGAAFTYKADLGSYFPGV